MRFILFLILLFPEAAFAQLDRIRTNMTEEQFRVTVPEAQRNLEAESGWIEDTGSVEGLSGSLRWRVYNDSIESFHFTSNEVQGPSELFPSVDSSEVHMLKQQAELLRAKIEVVHGKPRTFYNSCLTCATPMDYPYVYIAAWEGISICVSIKSNFLQPFNAFPLKTIRKSETYEFFLTINSSSPYLQMKYEVGRPVTSFLQKYPEYEAQAKFTHIHTYTIVDTATGDNALWQFIFVDHVLTYMDYNAWLGSNYGDNDVSAFATAKKRSVQLLKEAKLAHGKPSAERNNVPKEYVVHTDYLEYHNDYMSAEWKRKDGISSVKFIEFGGGKHVGTTFHIQYVFEREK